MGLLASAEAASEIGYGHAKGRPQSVRRMGIDGSSLICAVISAPHRGRWVSSNRCSNSNTMDYPPGRGAQATIPAAMSRYSLCASSMVSSSMEIGGSVKLASGITRP